MSDLQNRLKNLTPEQRAILEKKLREKALAKADKEKISVPAVPLVFVETEWGCQHWPTRQQRKSLPAVTPPAPRATWTTPAR